MLQMYILEFKNRKGSPLYHLEHYIEGDYVKYNSNSGFVEDSLRHTPQVMFSIIKISKKRYNF
jgi:elongation factor 2 kinase